MTMEKKARDYVSGLLAATEAVSSRADNRVLAEDDRQRLSEALSELQFAFAELDRLFINRETGDKREAGYLFLGKLISAAVTAGSLALVSEPSQRFAHFTGQKNKSRKPRPGAESPFHAFIVDCLDRHPKATVEEILKAFADDDTGAFDVEGEIIIALGTDKTMKISTLPKAISLVRKKV
jgi:hypothetical protein